MRKRPDKPKLFLAPEETALVEQAIAQAEMRTSAEIKFIIARYCWGNVYDKAVKTFRKLGLHKTVQRNCVLILLVTTNCEFAIVGDSGIHAKAGQEHWDDVRNSLAVAFRKGEFAQGLCDAIAMIGEQLAEHFPRQAQDINEISNGVGYEK